MQAKVTITEYDSGKKAVTLTGELADNGTAVSVMTHGWNRKVTLPGLESGIAQLRRALEGSHA